MCSVIAHLARPSGGVSDQAVERLSRVMRSATDRGRDAIGLAAVKDDGIVVHAWQPGCDVDSLLRERAHQIRGARCVIGLCRAIPTTEAAITSGPYHSHGWVVGHNGLVANDHQLTQQLGLTPTSPVDSAMIPPLLDRMGWDSALDMLEGSFAMLAVQTKHPKQIRWACDYRPLFCSADSHGVWIASMAHHLEEQRIWFRNFGLPRVEQITPYTQGFVQVLDGQMNFCSSSWAQESTNTVLMVASGGLDSTVGAHQLIEEGWEVEMLHVQYGARSATQEKDAVQRIAQELGCRVHILETDLFAKYLRSNLTDSSTRAEESQGGVTGAETAHDWVPARNLILLSLATGYAEQLGCDGIGLGNNLEEAGSHPDNEQAFIQALQRVMPYATNLRRTLKVLQPVGGLMKHEIVALGLELGTPMELTWSCYNDEERHCGTCGPCYMRRTAFEINEATDPVMTA